MKRTFCALVALLSSACGGYSELPLPTRETADLQVEALDLYPDGLGLLQIAATLPDDVEPPLYVISEPWISEPGVTAVGWAIGPCPSLDVTSTPAPWRGCISLYTPSGPHPPDFNVDIVIESIASERRFTLTAEVNVP
jgi:hypothetical protein